MAGRMGVAGRIGVAGKVTGREGMIGTRLSCSSLLMQVPFRSGLHVLQRGRQISMMTMVHGDGDDDDDHECFTEPSKARLFIVINLM